MKNEEEVSNNQEEDAQGAVDKKHEGVDEAVSEIDNDRKEEVDLDCTDRTEQKSSTEGLVRISREMKNTAFLLVEGVLPNVVSQSL